MIFNIHYGPGRVQFSIPKKNLQDGIRPWKSTEGEETAQYLENNREVEAFKRAVHGQHVSLLLPDASRHTPFIKYLSDILIQCQGCRALDVLICTGTHSALSAANQSLLKTVEKCAKETGVSEFRCTVHDCHAKHLVDAGTTSRGTPVFYHPWLQVAKVFLVLSDVKVHYFAGYSNPIKNFVPGLCGFETVEKNHRWALHEQSTYGFHPWQKDRTRQGNPLAHDQWEGMEMIVGKRPVYAWVTISSEGRINWQRFGPAAEVTGKAFQEADERNTHGVRPVSRLIVSSGGHPHDMDLYIAQRALELTQAAIQDDGEILFLAACPGGVGEPHTLQNFYERLIQPLDCVLESVQQDYVLYSHKPYKFARLLQRIRQIWMVTDIPVAQVEAMHMRAAPEPQTVIDQWLSEDPEVKISFVDGANKVALYRKD